MPQKPAGTFHSVALPFLGYSPVCMVQNGSHHACSSSSGEEEKVKGEHACLLEGYHLELATFTIIFTHMATSNCEVDRDMWSLYWTVMGST